MNSPSPARPLIGICASNEVASWTVWREQPAVLVGRHYVDRVRDCGADVVLLAPGDHLPRRLLGEIDGLLLAGGLDVNPGSYSAEVDPHCEAVDPERDNFEIRLVTWALERDLPLLGICRGLQVINVALGGTLHQDLESMLGTAAHRPAPGSLGPDSAHRVELLEGSLASRIASEVLIECRSHHHQAVDLPGRGVVVSGRSAEDGVCEAIEVEDKTFVVGVQWHAEATPGDAFIPAFAAAAGRFSSGRSC